MKGIQKEEERGMKVSHKITETERNVMEVLWENSDPVATRELLEMMKEKGKSWKIGRAHV